MEKTISRYRVVRTGNVSRAIENHMYPTQYFSRTKRIGGIADTIDDRAKFFLRFLQFSFLLFLLIIFSPQSGSFDEKKIRTKIVPSNRILIFSPKILSVARSHGNGTKQLCRLHKMADTLVPRLTQTLPLFPYSNRRMSRVDACTIKIHSIN